MNEISTEEEFHKLPLAEMEIHDLSFDHFYYLTGAEIEELCLKVPIKQRPAIRKVWRNHPKRQPEPLIVSSN